MARLRVRSLDNLYWIDVCYSEWYVRAPNNRGWRRIYPGDKVAVRSSWNRNWLAIGCEQTDKNVCQGQGDPYDPNNPSSGNKPGVIVRPPEGPTPGSGSGEPTPGVPPENPWNPTPDPTKPEPPKSGEPQAPGSYDQTTTVGDGQGSGGTAYDPVVGYPPGYDLPDASEPQFTIIEDPASPSGVSIVRPGINAVEYIQPNPPNTTGAAGTWDSPAGCPVSISSSGTHITQTIHDLGAISDTASISYAVYSGGLSLDIYHGGKLIATTQGEQTGRGRLGFVFDTAAANTDTKIMVKARSQDPTSEWTYLAPCPTAEPTVDEPGTPANPLPCQATLEPSWGAGTGVQETYHNMGSTAGEVVIEYEMFNKPDRMDVYYKGRLAATTGTYVSNGGKLSFNYTPEGTVEDLVIRVQGQEEGTSYVYRIFCPGEAGSESSPVACGNPSYGKGAQITDTFYEMGQDSGLVVIDYHMQTISDKVEVYQGSTLVTDTGFVTGESSHTFWYDAANGTKLLYRVIGSSGTTFTWGIVPQCPKPHPDVTMSATKELDELNTGIQEFEITLTLAYPTIYTATLDWATVYSANADAQDLDPQSGSVSFAPGEVSKVIKVQTKGDTLVEPDEHFGVTLSNFNNLRATVPSISLTIVNDDQAVPPNISVQPVGSVNVTEGNANVCANITLDNPTQANINVSWAFVAVSATDGQDFNVASGVETFLAGQTQKQVCTTILDDSDIEPTESFKIVISGASFGNITVPEVEFFILDNDSTVVPCNNQSNSGGSGVTVTAHELGSTPGQASVQWDFYQITDKIKIDHNGQTLFETPNFVAGTGSFAWAWNPAPTEPTQITVTVTGSSSNTGWQYTVNCPA